jgi:hypothetical protein
MNTPHTARTFEKKYDVDGNHCLAQSLLIAHDSWRIALICCQSSSLRSEGLAPSSVTTHWTRSARPDDRAIGDFAAVEMSDVLFSIMSSLGT